LYSRVSSRLVRVSLLHRWREVLVVLVVAVVLLAPVLALFLLLLAVLALAE